MKWQAGLKQWRLERGLTSLQPNYIEMMQEELDEQEAAIKADDWHEHVDSICDQLVITTNAIEQTKPLVIDYELTHFAEVYTKNQLLAQYAGTEYYDDLDVLHHIYNLLIVELINLGVIPDLAMKEVVKHISARQIDPAKRADWEAGKLQKWPKDPNQSEDTLYEPNYKVCRSKPRG